jgi:hypothetical protein
LKKKIFEGRKCILKRKSMDQFNIKRIMGTGKKKRRRRTTKSANQMKKKKKDKKLKEKGKKVHEAT